MKKEEGEVKERGSRESRDGKSEREGMAGIVLRERE